MLGKKDPRDVSASGGVTDYRGVDMDNATAKTLRPSEAENTQTPGTAEWYFMEADLTLQASGEWDIEPAHAAHLVEVAKVQAMLAQYRLASDGKACTVTAPDWDEMHITPRGVMHSGSRARCASSDQTPPMVEDLECEGDEDDYDLRPETARGEAS